MLPTTVLFIFKTDLLRDDDDDGKMELFFSVSLVALSKAALWIDKPAKNLQRFLSIFVTQWA